MIDDGELLRRYARDGSEEAFDELVRRHVDLVYTAALRRLGNDRHLAEDVTQVVFRDLARKSAALSWRREIAGWLYTSARFAATDLVRSEQSRKRREQEAFAMSEIEAATPGGAGVEQLRPLLEESIDRLDSSSREAVLLRFFEKRPFAEIGAMLGVSEDAAQKRVDRALDKLRGIFARRGVTSTASALSVALGEHAVSAAPAALARSVCSSVAAGVASGSPDFWASQLFLMSTNKAVVGAAVLFATASLSFLGLRSALAKVDAIPPAFREQAPVPRITAAGTGALPLAADSLPMPQSAFARLVALDPDWIELFRENPDLARNFLRMLGEASPALGMEVAAELERLGFQYTKGAVIDGWVAADPMSAWQWAVANDENFGMNRWTPLIALGKAAEASAIIRHMPGATKEELYRRNNQARNLLTYWTKESPADAAEWLKSWGNDQSFETFLIAYAHGRSMKEPLATVEWAVGELPPGSNARRQALGMGVREWAKVAPLAEVGQWLAAHKDGDDYTMATVNLANAYLDREGNAPAALQWMEFAPPGLNRDMAGIKGVSYFANTAPEDAIRFLNLMTGPVGRLNAARRIAERWVVVDPEAVKKYLDSGSNLSAEERAVFVAALEGRNK